MMHGQALRPIPTGQASGRVRARVVCLLVFLAGVASAQDAASPSIALVVDIVGEAKQDTAPADALRLLAPLAGNAVVVIGSRSEIVVFYLAEGAQYRLTGPGRFRLRSASPEALDGAAIPAKTLAPAPMRDLKLRTDRIARAGLLMRGDAHPALIQPMREVVLDDTVEFAWESFGDGTEYQFELVDLAGRQLFTAQTPYLRLRLTPAVTLTPGSVYYWAIRGRDATGASFYRTAEFRLADAVTQRRLKAAEPKPDAPFAERALYAALLADAGARSAAQAQREKLAAERPAGWVAEP